MVEFYANNAVDTPDYLIGEEIYIANVRAAPTRGPSLHVQPEPRRTAVRPNCWSSTASARWTCTTARARPTTSSTCWRKAAAPRPSAACSHHFADLQRRRSLAGIGRAKAEKIWYRALTVYMTSSTNYAGARAATLSAATDLYGRAASTSTTPSPPPGRAVNVN